MVSDKEPDPHELTADGLLKGFVESRSTPITGSVASLLPQWRRKPPYRTLADGSAEMFFAGGSQADCGRWRFCFVRDARLNFIRSHLHVCQNTCFKSDSDEQRVACRFKFFHEFEVLVHRPRPYKRRVCRRQYCPFQGKKLCQVIKRFPVRRRHGGPKCDDLMHPLFCPAVVPCGQVVRKLRRGKALVLPRELLHLPGQFDFLPVVQKDSRYGRLGKVGVLRYHPSAGSSNPVGLPLLRCNWDVQCMARVFVDDVDDYAQVMRQPEFMRGSDVGVEL